jgi:hypothetical protein
MTTEFSPQLRQSLDRLIGYDVIEAQPNWGDVAQRAARGRRRSLVLAILACFALAVFVSAAFAFGTDLWQLVAGKPVSTKRLSPEERRMFASLASGRPMLRTQPNDPARADSARTCRCGCSPTTVDSTSTSLRCEVVTRPVATPQVTQGSRASSAQ